MTIDVERVRGDTPACEKLIHLNNAGASLMPSVASDCFFELLRQEQEEGGYETAVRRAGEIGRFYAAAARMLNCSPGEIAYFDGSTRAWQAFFYAVPMRPGQRIITTQIDYGANVVAYLHRQQRDGVEVVYVPSDENGDLDMEAFERAVDERTCLISVSHIPTGGGTVFPAGRIGQIAAAADVPFLLDACQSAGQLPLDVSAIGCAGLAAAGRKYLRGPRGTGFLYVAEKWLDRLNPVQLEQQSADLIDEQNYRLAAGSRRFENFEAGLAARAALAKSLDYACDLGLEAIRDRVYALGAECRSALSEVPGVAVMDRGSELCGIVTFQVEEMAPADVRSALHDENINVWISTGPGNLVDFQRRGIDALVRASVHYYNTREEIDRLATALARLQT